MQGLAHRPWTAPTSIALLAVALYGQTLGFEFVWDDHDLLRNMELAYRDGGVAGVLLAPFRILPDVPTGYYRPVTYLSLWTDRAVGSGRAFVFHLSNVSLHAACSLLVWRLVKEFVLDPFAACVGGWIFAAHPVHVDSVAFVSGRTDLWALFFSCACALAWANSRRTLGWWRVAWIAAGLAAFALALGSKEIAFFLPGVLLVWDLLEAQLHAGERRTSSWLGRNGVWILGWSALIGANLLLRRQLDPASALSPGWESYQAWSGAERMRAIAAYLRLLVLPWPLRPYYTWNEVPASLVNALAAVFVTAVLAYLLWNRSTRLASAAGAAWLAIFLAPMLGWFPVRSAVVAERFLYFPSAGFALLVGALIVAAAARRRVAIAVACATVAASSVATYARAPVWQNGVSLFRDAVAKAPSHPDSYSNLAIALSRQGQKEAAVGHFQRALELDPATAKRWYDLGTSLRDVGRTAQAIDAFLRAIHIDPKFLDAWLNLGQALLARGDFVRARTAYEDALSVDSRSSEALAGLAVARAATGDPEGAGELLARLAGQDPALAAMAAQSIDRMAHPQAPPREAQ